MTDNSFTEILRESAMLATLTTNSWGIQRTQRDLSDTIAIETSGQSNAFAVRKNLLAGADRHQKELVSAIALFRAFLYRKSLPFSSSGTMVDRGPRMVANADFFAIHEQLAEARARITFLLNEFETVYDDAIETARRNLGTAFNQADYPPFDEVRDAFRLDVEFSPLPARGGFGASLSDSIASRLDDEIEERHQQKARVACQEVRQRAKDLLARLRDRADAAALHDPSTPARRPRITVSMFEAATELGGTIQTFAPLTSVDPGLDAIASQLFNIGAYTIDDLYEQPAQVREALDKLASMLA